MFQTFILASTLLTLPGPGRPAGRHPSSGAKAAEKPAAKPDAAEKPAAKVRCRREAGRGTGEVQRN